MFSCHVNVVCTLSCYPNLCLSSVETILTKVIVAVISIWLWVGHKDSCEHAIVENGEEDPNMKWLITLAVEMSLSALAKFFDALPTGNKDCSTNDYLNQVASIASESLTKQVVVDDHTVSSWVQSSMIVDLFSNLTGFHFHRMLPLQYWMICSTCWIPCVPMLSEPKPKNEFYWLP